MKYLLLFVLSFSVFYTCADPVEDINRVQPNLIAKSDLEGEWYMLQTIVDVPPTSFFTFIGETSMTERVRWEIQEDMIIAYRSYERMRGARAPSTKTPFDGTENPIAAYRIMSHVDIRREYNSSTGEQSNIISENMMDRPWFDREYVRVDWSLSLIPNFEFIAPTGFMSPGSYFEPAEKEGADSLYMENDDQKKMSYFDVTGHYMVEPDLYGCIYTLWYLGVEDCASAEIGIRTSFARVPKEKTYEPFQYDDQMMSRFGYFRSEYYEYDEQRGARDAGRRTMINRHNIWQSSYDNEGKTIPIEQRKAKAVPYYLNEFFPEDLEEAAYITMRQWNEALVTGLTVIEPSVLSELDQVDGQAQIFILCHNPVQASDPKACGEEGKSVRVGDLRYSTLHWVDSETLSGLLGYGPAAVDPISGETISGRAYIYGAAVNTYASYALDVIRYFSEEVGLEALIHGENFSQAVRDRLATRSREDGRSAHPLKSLTIQDARKQARPKPKVKRENLHPYDAEALQSRLEAVRGKRPNPINQEFKKAMESKGMKPWEELPQAMQNFAQDLSPALLKKIQKYRKHAISKSADLIDMIAPDIEGLVRKYSQEYTGDQDDELWRKLRAEIFAAVAEHEVGHTVGLRHNFQGSYDSLNYFEEYWPLREDNLKEAVTVDDFFQLNQLTQKQHDGLMRQKQYSSIMDYGYGWQNDLAGLGKYDKAALIFGYTSHLKPVNDCQVPELNDPFNDTLESDSSRLTQDPCVAPVRGLVEVFKKNRGELGCAGDLLDPPTQEDLNNSNYPEFSCTLIQVKKAPKREYARNQFSVEGPSTAFEGFSFDDPGLPSVNLLERYHYTTVAQAFPSLDDISQKGREWMLYEDYIAQRNQGDYAKRKLRVPYLFCSDEWEGGLVSCNAFDQGADPYEIVQGKIYSYEAYYPFVNFRRDRPDFEIWHPLFTYFFRDFLPLSDVFQNWYIAPYGFDDLFDLSYEAAISGGISLLFNVMATPPYGMYCETDEGRLLHLSDDPTLQGEEVIETTCNPDGTSVYMPPGQGRRYFSSFDPEAGYLFEFKPQEAGHYWATLAALWALFDPEAYLIGIDGDAGVYSISYFDWFEEEIFKAFGDILTRDFKGFAPRALPKQGSLANNAKEQLVNLQYRPVSSLYGYDPLTGQVDEDPAGDLVGGPASLCDECEEDTDCAGYTGNLGGAYCQPLADNNYVCMKDCTNEGALCPEGTMCDEVGNCIPGANLNSCTFLRGECNAEFPLGRCEEGSTCREGSCYQQPEHFIVESNPTFMLKTDVFWYGFLLTTFSYSTRFNDELNVFRPGTPGEVVVSNPQEVEQITFTNPVTGVSYAATQPRCLRPEVDTVDLYGSCKSSEDCVGFETGSYGEVFCQPIEENSYSFFCLQDCTNDASLCSDTETCNDTGNCVPIEEGVCVDYESAYCKFNKPSESVAVRLVKRGQELEQLYSQSMNAIDTYRAGDQDEFNQLYRNYYRNRYYLQNHVDLLETLRATYDIFGKLY
jgi:hypothetical protein